MIRILSEITPRYAEAFQKICSMHRIMVAIDEAGNPADFRDNVVVPYAGNEEEMKKLGLPYSVLNELDTLGLIKFSTLPGFVTTGIPENCTICTYIHGVTKELEESGRESVAIGNVLLTDAGRCLSKITETIQIEEYELLEKAYMARSRIKYAEETAYEVAEDGEGNLYLKQCESHEL